MHEIEEQPNQDSVAMADYMALAEKYAALKAQRAWVDLTDDEEMIIALEQNKSRHWVVCEAIRQFKEKNHA